MYGIKVLDGKKDDIFYQYVVNDCNNMRNGFCPIGNWSNVEHSPDKRASAGWLFSFFNGNYGSGTYIQFAYHSYSGTWYKRQKGYQGDWSGWSAF